MRYFNTSLTHAPIVDSAFHPVKYPKVGTLWLWMYFWCFGWPSCSLDVFIAPMSETSSSKLSRVDLESVMYVQTGVAMWSWRDMKVDHGKPGAWKPGAKPACCGDRGQRDTSTALRMEGRSIWENGKVQEESSRKRWELWWHCAEWMIVVICCGMP